MIPKAVLIPLAETIVILSPTITFNLLANLEPIIISFFVLKLSLVNLFKLSHNNFLLEGL